MAWKIIFTYQDKSQLKVSNNKKALTKELAVKYQKAYARPSSDGGIVYISPYKSCTPVGLQEYINKLKSQETNITDMQEHWEMLKSKSISCMITDMMTSCFITKTKQMNSQRYWQRTRTEYMSMMNA